jgi:HAE1 family hydrophobic/amphiphilic exporter-1
MGEDPITAAKKGTAEVRLAVVATTLVVIAVFGPVAFMKGFTGQFFRQFGLTVCFAMAISLFDALTIAPMLSAYFAGGHGNTNRRSLWGMTVGALVRGFEKFQQWLENRYVTILGFTLRHPIFVLVMSVAIFATSFLSLSKVPKTFFPPADAGEFVVNMDLPPGSNLDSMNQTANQVEKIVRENPEVALAATTVGGANGEPNLASIYVRLIPSKERPKITTTMVKDRIREKLKAVPEATLKVTDFNPTGSGDFRPFMMRIIGNNQEELEKVGLQAFEILKKLNTASRSTFRPLGSSSFRFGTTLSTGLT